jgi:hypothetical protein
MISSQPARIPGHYQGASMNKLVWISVLTLVLTNFHSYGAEKYVADDATDLYSNEVDVVETPELSDDMLNLLGISGDLLDHIHDPIVCKTQKSIHCGGLPRR